MSIEVKPLVKYVQVLTTCRENNTAYVAESYRFVHHLEEIKRDDKWWNWVLPLNVIEKMFGCKFEDGRHPYVQGLLDAEDLDNLIDMEKAKGWKAV